MKKILYILLLLPVLLQAQIKVKNLPDKTSNFKQGDNIIIDDSSGAAGATKKISIRSLKTNYDFSSASSYTDTLKFMHKLYSVTETITGNKTFSGSNAYGTPASIVLTNGTGLPLTTGVTGILPGTNGGTGVNNSTRTITIAGNLTTTGAFNSTFVQQFSGNTTLPPSATTLAGSASALTSGRMPFATTNGLLLDDNALNWDNTNKYIKVGTGTFAGADIEVSKTSSAAGSTAIGVFNSTTDGNSSLNAGESNTNKAQLVFFNTAATGNYISSIANASLSVFRNRVSNVIGAGAIMINGTPIYGIVGSTTTNSGFRQDATGFRIDATSTLNTTNTSNFQVNGNVQFRYNAKTANYTASTDYLINCTANSFTITLPTAVGIAGRVYIIKNTGTATTITIATTSSELIDGSAPGTVVGLVPLRVMSTGAGWVTF